MPFDPHVIRLSQGSRLGRGKGTLAEGVGLLPGARRVRRHLWRRVELL